MISSRKLSYKGVKIADNWFLFSCLDGFFRCKTGRVCKHTENFLWGSLKNLRHSERVGRNKLKVYECPIRVHSTTDFSKIVKTFVYQYLLLVLIEWLFTLYEVNDSIWDMHVNLFREQNVSYNVYQKQKWVIIPILDFVNKCYIKSILVWVIVKFSTVLYRSLSFLFFMSLWL